MNRLSFVCLSFINQVSAFQANRTIGRMKGSVEVIKNDPLSWTRAVDRSLNFGGLQIKSVAMGMAYFRLRHSHSDSTKVQSLLTRLTTDRELMYQPWQIKKFLDTAGVELNWTFEVRKDRVMEAILVEQAREQGNPFREELERVLEEAGGNPESVVFKVYGCLLYTSPSPRDA